MGMISIKPSLEIEILCDLVSDSLILTLKERELFELLSNSSWSFWDLTDILEDPFYFCEDGSFNLSEWFSDTWSPKS